MRGKLPNGGKEDPLPLRLPPEEKKQHLNATIDPANRAWLRENWRRLGYRSESHAVDDAIRKLKESGEGRSTRNNGGGVPS